MKVGIVTTSYPRAPGDPAGVFVRDRVRALVRNGATVEILAAGAETGFDRDSDPGTRVWRIGAGSSLFYGAGAPEGLESRLALWGVAAVFSARLASELRVRAPGWDAIESHWLVPSALATAVVTGRCDHLAFAHGGDVALLERLPGGGRLTRIIVESGAELVFVSASLRARLAALCDPRVGDRIARARIEPAPADAEVFRPRPAEERRSLRQALAVRSPLALGVGRLVPVKGFDVLVRALGRLPPGRRPELALAGEGPERSALAKAAAARGLRIRLLGAIPRPTLAAWMAAADLYVHPARVLASGRSEGMPLAVSEALAAGLPVVASACGGLPELAAHPRLTLVPPGDPGALSAAVDRLLARA